jgi:hypothetical protein
MSAGAKKLDFASELAIGKPNSLGNTLIVAKAVESNPKLFSADQDFFDPHKESLIKVYSKTKHNVVKLGLVTL